MADDKSFKELIAEQKRTNKLLMQQMASEEKGSKLGTSIKNSAGEIINDVLIGNKQKRESDQTQAIIKKTSDKALDEDKKNQKESGKIWSRIADTLTGAFIGKGGGKSAADKENRKDEIARDNARIKKFFGKYSFLGKKVIGIFEGISGLAKSLYGKGKGILGVILGAVGYGLLLRYLNSPEFKEFIESGDAAKRIAAAARAIDARITQLIELFNGKQGEGDKGGGFLGTVARSLKKLSKDLTKAFKGKDEKGDPYGFTDAIMENKKTVAGIVLALYARTIATVGAGLLAKGLVKGAAALGITTGIKNLLFGKANIARGGVRGYGAGGLRAAGIIGIVLALFEGVKYMFSTEAQRRIDEGKSTYLSAGIGGFIGSFFTVGSFILSSIAKAVGLNDVANMLDAQDYKTMLDELSFDIINSFQSRFVSLYRGFKKFLFGTNILDEQSEIKKLQDENIEKIKMAEKLEKSKSPNLIASAAVFRAQVKQNEKTIEKRRERISAAEKGDLGFNLTAENEGNIPLQLKNLAGREAALARFKLTGAGVFAPMGKGEAKMIMNYRKSLMNEDTSDDLDLRLNPKTGGLELSGPGGFTPVVSTNIDAKTSNSTYLTQKTISNMSMHDVLYGR